MAGFGRRTCREGLKAYGSGHCDFEGGAGGELPHGQSTAAVNVMSRRVRGFTRFAAPSLAVLVTAGTLAWPSPAEARTAELTASQLYALLARAQASGTAPTDETSSPTPEPSTPS